MLLGGGSKQLGVMRLSVKPFNGVELDCCGH